MSQTKTSQPPAPIFFNCAHIDAAQDSVSFTLGVRANPNEQPALIVRLMTNPIVAKQVLSVLAQILAAHEEKFGEIKVFGIDSAHLQAKIRALCTLKREDLN